MKTVVGLYSTLGEANKVKSAIQGEGYEAAHIKVIDQTGEGYPGSTKSEESFTERVKDFFSGFSEHKDEHTAYANRIGSAGALLAVTVPDEEADETADLLYKHGATGIQEDYASTTGVRDGSLASDSKDYAGAAIADEQVIPVVQEELVIGKKQIDRGGVRVYSHVVETPVSANVFLHNERVVVDRRPVNRAATDADFATDPGVIEVQAIGEEAIVGKTSRVVEEVRVGKEATERTEAFHDTVRRTEVDVEPITVDTTKR